jgi:DNA mismatch repair protein MutS
LIDDLPLFRALPPVAPKPVVKASELEARLREVLPDELTPMEALRLVYSLKELVKP